MAIDRRTMAVAVLALLAAAAVGVAAAAIAAGRTQAPGRVSASGPVPDQSPASSAASATPSPTPKPAPSGPPVPVYVLGDTESGPRLYREFRAAAGGDAVRAAVAGLAETPVDPDYRTPWSGVQATSTARAGTDVTVTFAGAPRLRSPAEAVLAVQQVVHTVTAADPRTKRVRVVAPGLPAALTRAPLGRAPQVDVLAPIWLLSPAEGDRSGRKVVVKGTASVFEATVSVEVRRGSAVVATATATASVGGPGRGEWTATVRLPPGHYVVAAYEMSAKDWSRLYVDTKRITVE